MQVLMPPHRAVPNAYSKHSPKGFWNSKHWQPMFAQIVHQVSSRGWRQCLSACTNELPDLKATPQQQCRVHYIS